MPRPKGSLNKTTKRAAIQTAAMKVFCHYGYDGATLEKIAETAGVTRPLINQHFGTKQELAAQCLSSFIKSFFGAVKKLHENAKSYEEANRLTREQFKLYREEWRLVMAVLCTPSLAELHRHIVPTYLQEGEGVVATWRDQLQDPEDLKDLAYLLTAVHFSYVLGGNADNYDNGMKSLLGHYLMPSGLQ